MDTSQNAASYFVDRHLNEGRGDKLAFREAGRPDRTLTYGELGAQSGRAADGFLRMGMRREERAILLVRDQLEFPILFWGALKAGIVPIPLNTLLSTDVYDAILNDSRATALFVSQQLWPVVQPAMAGNPFVQNVVVIGGEAPEGTMSFTQFMADTMPRETGPTSIDETAFWLYSSGSTGAPKGVRHVHGALQATSDTYGAGVLGIEEGDTVYSVAKLFFAYGLGNAMTFPMSVGATTVLFDGRPTPDTVTEILVDEQPTVFCGVPTLFAAVLNHWDQTGAPPKAPLRRCISAGEALPEEIGKKWWSLWGVDILDGVGSTEMLHIFLSNAPGNVTYGTSGVAVPGYDLRLVDEEGSDVDADNVGELLVRGASASDGYWNKRDKSRATFEGEWTRTGDKYERREDGRYVYCGRTDDMFKVSGIWVSPFEVEQALSSHSDILESAVVAHQDEEGLAKPKAFVVLKDATKSCDPSGLQEFVKEKIGLWKYPRWIEFVEDLPKTATGKIQRFKLRD